MSDYQTDKSGFLNIGVADLHAQKLAMEEEIRAAIVNAVGKFKANTGLSPCAIDVQILSVAETGKPMKEYFVGEVSSDVPVW